MTHWHLRRARLSDSKSLSETIDAAYAAYIATIPDLPKVSEGIADDIKNHIVWVAEMDQAIIGGIVLMPQADCLHLVNVAVHPDSKGMGMGRSLLELAEQECLRLGFNELRLSTHLEMPGNVELYHHFGWETVAQVGNKIHLQKRL
jgi:N-acetylglutamate synthase-like GNAT family acetyltransferase